MLETDLQIKQFKDYASEIPVCVRHLFDRPWEFVDRAIEFECKRVQFFKPYYNQEMVDKAHENGMICNVFWLDEPKETGIFLTWGWMLF